MPTDETVALFDFDGTLTTRDTLMPFLHFVCGPRHFWPNLVRSSPALAGYLLGFIRNDVAKQLVLKNFLKGRSMSDLQSSGRDFALNILPSLTRPAGMARLSWHRQQGHRCVLVSASLDLYLRPWAASQGFHEVICSSCACEMDGTVSGQLHGENCYGGEKARRVSEWLASRESAYVYAYGDSQGDREMLEMSHSGWLWKNGDFRRVSS